jgi:hypothetical protein
MLTILTLLVAGIANTSPAADSTSTAPADSLDSFQWPETEIATALSYIRLTSDDLNLRSDYLPRDSCRLPQVDALMENPRSAPDFLRQSAATVFADATEGSVHVLVRWPDMRYLLAGMDEAKPYGQGAADSMSIPIDFFQSSPEWMAFLEPLQAALSESGWIDTVLNGFSPDDRRFVLERTPEFLLEDEADKDKSAEYLDSLQQAEDKDAVRFASLAGDIRWQWVHSHGNALVRDLLALLPSAPPRALTGPTAPDGPQSIPTPFGTIILGTPGADEYRGDAVLIIDPGGDDRYALSPLPAGANRLIVDYGGNDEYSAPQGHDLGSARFGWSVLIDRNGDDSYRAGSFSLGAGWFGIGALFDLHGSDIYTGDIFTQGAGAFGIGLLYDSGGDTDQYTGRLFAQGMGFAAGLGILADAGGNDIYTAGGKYEDILRYRDHFLSLSQGFGYGLRPHFSGGIGLLLDQNGNDIYIADIFGQACSYWWAFGGMYDGGGNDHYIAFQYAQGSATHLTAGCLLDIAGDDRYESKGVSQGCGHDWSSGMLIDLAGNDRYTANDLSQAAGSANGIGALIDVKGDDGYYVVSSVNTQGYGNPRREYGSVGLFLDLGGNDRYDGPGKDGTVWIGTSRWGVGVDADSMWLEGLTRK